MKKLSLLILAMQLGYALFAQISPKVLDARRTNKKVVVDGKLNESAWSDASMLDDFTEFRPVIGRKERPEIRTEAFLMYDDEGIYFGGTCYESTPDSISKELTGRDGFGANDYIGIIFDTYHDNLNGFEYFVTPLGEQWDAKMTSNQNSNNGGEDFAWNSVWKSAVVIHEKGWTFEIFLPYSAIRFSKDKIQDWGLNITRRRRKVETQNTWSAIDPNKNGFLTQEGTWKGIKDIKPPLRLQLYPYFSVYQNHFPANVKDQKNWTNQISGGMDMKLGLSQAFTLDATLIPDFGQVQSDNQVLNLTPFEVKFNENRQFFTEGTELFNKGNLFYSRRIGGRPINLNKAYDDVKQGEEMLNNPTEAKLINASKISGRTSKGLGIGILNAITKPQFATILNNETNEIRKFETDPTTNYNILVFDQNLKNNSSVSFINTRVLRGSQAYNANVSSAIFSLNDKKNNYNLSGSAAMSHINFKDALTDNSLGYSHSLAFGKTSGRFLFKASQELTDTKYNSNDLGYFTNNNFINHYAYLGYKFITPKRWYNRMQFNLNLFSSHLYAPIGEIDSKYQNARINFNFNAQHKKIFWFGAYSNFIPVHNDFYEPRILGQVFKRGKSIGIGTWLETNYAKKYAGVIELFNRHFIDFYKLNISEMYFNHGYRFSSKFSIRHNLSLSKSNNGLGFTTIMDDKSIFALRKVKTVDNTLNFKYNFNNKMGLTFRARHYASVVSNKEFFTLQKDGSLSKNGDINQNLDKNVNYFNIDMVYTWQFAPGSFLNAVWKNATVYSSDKSGMKYLDNLQNTLNSDQNNNLSLKVIYFLDYLSIKKKN
ncbi:MAG: carbohydrate binding family 9 domain-containing protein [Bacteroidetes bacterium]|nr:carbohydrate binding family 9 domain-containing protein [Bacteroidota bacterium]